MRLTKNISPYQFSCFRIVLGIFLTIHFACLVPYGSELFSREGVLADSRLNFTHGILPNPLEHFDVPLFITAFLSVLVVCSISFTAGYLRRTMALVLWFGWACLFNRNNLISNPSIPYVGLVLILTALIPSGEPLSLGKKKSEEWYFPNGVFWCAWTLLAIGYSFSGYAKLSSPSWIDGSALYHLALNPLARPGFFRDVLLRLPDFFLYFLTWGALIAELLFLPLMIHRITRFIAWVSMIGLHLGILLVVDFADLTMGMLMIHFFTFDPDWFRPRSVKGTLVLFDGVCGLCNRFVRFALVEDRGGVLSFAPLQGQTAATIMARNHTLSLDFDSVVLIEKHGMGDEVVYTKSDAAFKILSHIGGFWRVVSWLRVIPKSIRDAGYDLVARKRYRWFGMRSECMLPSPDVKARFLN